jgi:ribosomal protein S18 acetylase RimI-like enzyme
VNIVIKEDSINIAVEVSATIVEFDKPYDKSYFEDRYLDSEKLILVTYVDDNPAGYMVSYDKDKDGSFYCWMAGVNPIFRRHGLLNKMMQYLIDWAKSNGYKKITIKTRNNRREMLSYLVKSGFYFTKVESQPSIEDNRILLERMIA